MTVLTILQEPNVLDIVTFGMILKGKVKSPIINRTPTIDTLFNCIISLLQSVNNHNC